MLAVVGSPLAPFADAIFTRLSADATLLALAPGGLYASLPRDARVAMPYIVVGRREMTDEGGAMQLEAGMATVFVDVWSAYNGPSQAQDIQSRIRALLLRQPLTLAGSAFRVNDGSVHCPHEIVLPDFDPDMPERSLFHGVQQWVAWLEAAC